MAPPVVAMTVRYRDKGVRKTNQSNTRRGNQMDAFCRVL
jgi:hypothetical protein